MEEYINSYVPSTLTSTLPLTFMSFVISLPSLSVAFTPANGSNLSPTFNSTLFNPSITGAPILITTTSLSNSVTLPSLS